MELHFYLLRGLIREQEHWGDFPTRLQETFPHSQMTFIEIPGTGQLFKKKSNWSLAEVVKFCKPHYKVKSRPNTINIAISISLGGMVVSEWLKHYPGDFQGVALINSSFKGFSPMFKRVRLTAIKSFFNIALTKSLKDKEAKIINLISNNKENQTGVLDKWVKIQEQRPVSISNAFRQIWSAATFDPILKAPDSTKVLILASQRDRLCDYTCSVKIHHYWQGRIRFHQTAGHDLPIDDPKWVISHIQEFVHYNFSE